MGGSEDLPERMIDQCGSHDGINHGATAALATAPLTRGEARKIWSAHGGANAPPLGPDLMTIPADQFHDFVAAIVKRALT